MLEDNEILKNVFELISKYLENLQNPNSKILEHLDPSLHYRIL